MNKEEVIKTLKNKIADTEKTSKDYFDLSKNSKLGYYHEGRVDGLIGAFNLINQLDEPERPVVPQFVADFIEYEKIRRVLFSVVYELERTDGKFVNTPVKKWIFQNTNLQEMYYRQETFIKAWLYGYEIEKKEYIVRLGKAFVRADSKISINREKAHIYKNKAYAERRAKELGGIVEEVSK